ncbi:MAG: hypothetical protein ACH255_21295, partial [Candidatus Thiodiazotropha sp.]
VWQQLYMDNMHVKKKSLKRGKLPAKPYKFKRGDCARISNNRHTFQRDYQQKWTEEIVQIHYRYLRQGIPV